MTKASQQESLIVVAEKAGLMHVPNPEADPLANDRISQKLYLLNSLQDLAAAKLRDGFLASDPAIAKERYGDQASQVREGADRNRAKFLVSAEENFKRASKYYELSDHYTKIGKNVLGWVHPLRVYRPMYSDFLKRFYTPAESFEAVRDERQRLISEISDMQGWTQPEDFVPAVSQFNRTHGNRPHKQEVTPSRKDPILGSEPDTLTTIDKLNVIQGDPRAQFIPKTNHAKTITASWLDYLDNPKYPAGISNQLFEVYISNQKRLYMTPPEAARALESKAYEVEDHAADALQSLEHIRDLQAKVAEIMAPHVSLAEEFPDGHPGLYVWARHRALKELMVTGSVQGLDKPLAILRTGTYPPPSERPHGNEPGKHKTLLNQFTRPDVRRKYKKYVEDLVSRTRIGEVRGDFDEIVTDLTNEFEFFKHRLLDIADIGSHSGDNPRFHCAQDAARKAVAELVVVST